MFARLAALTALALLASPAGQPQPDLDLIIRHGTIVDGSGGRRFTGDVGVRGDRIVAIGNLATRRAAREIDARGLMVTPGFINLHSHATAPGLRVAENMLSQGVTTEILNADGSSPLDIKAQLQMLDTAGLALNAGAAIGFNSVWSSVVGATDRRPTADEMAKMQGLIQSNLEAGAYAVSSGLDYKPGFFATEAEVVQVVSPARKWRTNFPNHDRVLPETRYSARAAVQETMRIGEQAGMVPVITHMKVSGRERTQGHVVLGEMAAYTKRGVYTAADVYPYLSGMTGLADLTIPGWAQNGGPIEMRKRFADPEQRKRIIAETDETMLGRFTGPQGVLVLGTGKTLADFMTEFGTTSPADALVRILEKSSPRAILGFGDESDLVKILKFPSAAVSCDCGATNGSTGHPRNFGTFPRVLGRYVREQKHLTWEEAIRKMTALPATIVGMVDRGYLAVGMHADITVFDTATVIDHATFESPGLKSEGIRHVVVNGTVTYRDGQLTGEKAGRALYRASWMPSRPMTAHAAQRRLAAAGLATPIGDGGVPLRLSMTLSQAAGTRRATGVLRLTDPASGDVMEATTLGVLQVGSRWGSVSGLMKRRSSGEERPFVLTYERADPFVDGSPQTVTLSTGTDLVRATLK
ncbi:MAG: amidohydrolase family protein [Gemmatimonadetes bacterium]|nr:amidohydrolase family protein [Gemmatimonadota bacterium]